MQIRMEGVVTSSTVAMSDRTSTYCLYNECRHYGASTHCAHLRARDIVGMQADIVLYRIVNSIAESCRKIQNAVGSPLPSRSSRCVMLRSLRRIQLRDYANNLVTHFSLFF